MNYIYNYALKMGTCKMLIMFVYSCFDMKSLQLHQLFFRNFRCDCGNSKFGGKKCKLYPVSKVFLDFNFHVEK